KLLQGGPPRLHRFGRVLAFQSLDARLLIAAQHQFPVLVEPGRIQVEFADGQSLLFKDGVVAVQPGTALVRLEVRLRQDTLDGAATHVAVVRVLEDFDGQIFEGPVGDRDAEVGRLGGDQDKDLVTLFRGKKPAGDRSAGDHAGPEGVGGRSGYASVRRCRGHRRVLRRPGDWWAGRVERSGE